MKEAKLLWKYFKLKLQEEMVYRLNFILLLLTYVIYDFFGPVLMVVVYHVSKGFPNWNFYEVLVLQASAIILEGLFFLFCNRLLFEIEQSVATGRFDIYLIRPISSLFLLFFSSCLPYGLFSSLAGVLILTYALLHLKITLSSMLFYLIFLSAGFLFLISLTIIITSISFFVIRIKPLRSFIFMLIIYGKYPLEIYPSFIRILFTFILPISLISYFPAKAILGKLFGFCAIYPLLISAFFFSFSLLLWRIAIRKYTSAGG